MRMKYIVVKIIIYDYIFNIHFVLKIIQKNKRYKILLLYNKILHFDFVNIACGRIKYQMF